MSESFDFVVIGGGSAGYAGAAAAARLGLKTAVVEGGRDVGGLCILRGCMPSKTLLESAARAESVRRASEFGLGATYLGADGKAIIARKRRLIAEFASYRQEQLESGKFQLFRATAAFVDAHTLELNHLDGGSSQISARSFLIATGSRIQRINLAGLEETGVWDSDEVLDEPRIPRSVVVLGGGAIGLEFASFYAGIGTQVTVLQRSGQLLKEMDEDIARVLAEAMEGRGVRVLCNTQLMRIERSPAGKRVVFSHDCREQSAEGEEIIYALGREPNTAGLQLERVGVSLARRGIAVSDSQQTSAPHIFAAGDVCGRLEVVHLAVLQGEVAARNAARCLRGESGPLEQVDYSTNLFAVFTHPEVASVGLTEREAAARGRDFLAATYPFNDHGKSLVRGETDGFVKLIVERESRRILGGAVIGPEASELIHEIAVAMHFRATAGDLARVPHYHPTLSEIWTYPAEELAGDT